ncbi:hypothetical protein ABPG77_007388 [Micractinium sp. CCAP 211/92]
MADGRGALGGSGGTSAGGDLLHGGFSSFDAASFFAQQQQQQDELRAQQGQQLQAVADMLLPSSSDEDSEGDGSSASEAGGEEALTRGRQRSKKRRRGEAGSSAERSSKRRHGSKGSKEERRRRKEKEREKEKKQRRQQRERERDQQVLLERQTGAGQRAPQVKSWAGSAAAGSQEPYYYDTRGDPANLAFGGLYRMDIALYRRHDPTGFAARLGARRRGPASYGVRYLSTEADGHAQHDRAARYFGPTRQRLERSARLKRWRRSRQPLAAPGSGGGGGDAALLGWRRPPAPTQQAAQGHAHPPRMQLPSPGFLPLKVEEDASPPAGLAGPRAAQQAGQAPGPQQRQFPTVSAAEELAAEQAAAAQRDGETSEEMLLRRTKEYNLASRERPYDIQLWLEFARFQDEAARLRPTRRGGERAVAEKKLSILEKALSLHPGSDELLLALLSTAEAVCDDAELERRWRAVLERHSGSPRLWRAYLQFRRTSFSGFRASEVAAAHDDAFAALHREHQRRATQGAPHAVLAALECEAVAAALEGCLLRLAAGATERGLAVALVLLEFNFFAPEGWPEDALEAMFEEFWRSGAPMVGQPGAAGWAAWMAGGPAGSAAAAAAEGSKRRRERERQDAEAAEAQQAQPGQAGDWSGWEELAPAVRARFGHALDPGGDAAADEQQEGSDGQEDDEEQEAEETDEQLLERLGLSLEAALDEASEAPLTPPLLDAWLAAERQRQAAQWAPRRAEAAVREQAEEEDEEAAALRTVAWRHVRRLLWRFESSPARQQLLAGCLLLLLGAPLPGALPSNSPVAAATSGDPDELWRAAALAGCHPAGSGSGGCLSSAAGPWAAELLARGDWGWLVGAGGAPAEPRTLRQQPWYRADPSRQAMLEHLLAALVRGPCRQDALVAAALVAVAAEGGSGGASKPLDHARTLAKQLLAEQRSNLLLWQAYAQLELAAGNAKAARKVYQTCFATVGAPAGLAAASAAAPLVLGAARLELQQGSPAGPGAAPPALPSPVDAAPSGGGDGGLLPTAVAAASDAAAAAAARQLAWLGSGGAVALPAGGGGLAAVAPLQDEVVAAKRGFQDHLLAVVQQQQQRAAAGAAAGPAQASAGLSAGVRGLIAAAAAFELVLGRLRGSLAAGVKAALVIYDQVLAVLLPDQAGGPQAGAAELADAQLELLSWQRCALAADAARRAVPGAPPAAAREALLRMLRRFPGSPPLLQLLVAHEMAGHTLTQLRRELGGLLEVAPSPQVWLAMLAVEVGSRSPSTAIAATLERAVSHPSGRACPLLWRCFLRFEAHRGRHEAVRRLFLRAIGACPWSKAIWCDGLALLNGTVPPKELSEYLEVMKDKDLVMRTDVFEVALAQLEGGAALNAH